MNDFDEKLNGATENSSSAVFSDWVNKLKFDRSFSAKLILSDKSVKEYYADIATEILKFERVKSRTNWSGVTFSVGRERFATVAFAGKTLCLFLAIDPTTLESGKYKARNVEDVKKHAKTPAMLRIKSDGGKRYAVKLINLAAENFNLAVSADPIAPVNPADFKTDTFNNLITRGLIRVLRRDRKSGFNQDETDVSDVAAVAAKNDEKSGYKSENAGNEEVIRNAYDDTVFTINNLLTRHGIYGDISSALSEGNCRASFTEKLMLRAVDEIWVRAIEDCVNSLDELIRNPNHYIAETEEVLPIELTKKITGRSVAHLCRHTDYLREDNDEIMPTKMLNIFRDDSFMTYENKFLNTLIKRLYLFVGRRYDVMKERGADEKTQTLEFENAFGIGEGKARVKISVEYSERNETEDAEKVLAGSGLWARVERLYSIVTSYINSSFVKEMGESYIRPPVLRTNAIIKNKYFRECLALWEFIETYDDSGYGISVEEREKEISPEFAARLFADAATLYYTFRHNTDEHYGEDDTREYAVIPDVILSDGDFGKKYAEEFEKESDVRENNDDISFALIVAMAADDKLEELGESGAQKPKVRRKSFAERLCIANDIVKENYVDVVNAMLKYKGVKLRYSRGFATIRRGRTALMRIAFAGRPLKVYFNLPKDKIPEKYRAKDATGIKRYVDTPYFIKIKSARGLRYVFGITELLENEYSLTLAKKTPEEIEPEDLTFENLGVIVMPEVENIQATNAGEVTQNAEVAFTAEKDGNVAAENTEKSGYRSENAQNAYGENAGNTVAVKVAGADERAEGAAAAGDTGYIPEPDEKPALPKVAEYGDRISFGSAISQTTVINAETAQALAVGEGSVIHKDGAIENAATGNESAETAMESEKPDTSAADVLEGFTRIDNDYEKPTEFGIDDASGFISDEREAAAAEMPVRKFTFGKRRKKK